MGRRPDQQGTGSRECPLGVPARPRAEDPLERAAPHGLERLGPGLVRVALDGAVSEAQAEAVLDFGRAQAAGDPPRVDVLAVVGGVGAVHGDARRVFRRGLETLPVGAVAIVGLGPAARVAARVFFGALRIARVAPFAVRFCAHEEAARRWLQP